MPTLHLPDHTTAVTERGDPREPVVLLLHSAVLDRQVWASTAARLRGVRVITYDLRGHGAAADAPPVEGVDHLAADVGAVLDALRLDRVDLVGLSLGGAVAQRFAADHPGRVRSLALVATAIRFPVEPLIARAESYRRNPGEAVDTALRRWFRPDNLAANTGYVRYARKLLTDVTVARWEAVWRALAGFDCTTTAARVRVPVLGIAGEHDASTPPAAVRELVDAYPHSRFAGTVDAQHLVPLEQPDVLAGILQAFLTAR